MSMYTTGEMAKLCGVSVRTVQYYDVRGILTPSELTEGGRRLYSEDDLRRMRIICFLRELDLPINSIKELLAEGDSQEVLSILLEQQQKTLETEIAERQQKLQKLTELKATLKKVEHFSLESVGDIAYLMENKAKLRKVHRNMILVGILMDIIEVSTLLLWTLKGIWLPFALGMCFAVGLGAWMTVYYCKKVAYICPKCHAVFKPRLSQMLFAAHTPSTRRLTCTECGSHGFCVEVYGTEQQT